MVKLDCMSVDPYMRSRMSGDGPGIVKTRKYRLLIIDKICLSYSDLYTSYAWMDEIRMKITLF